MTCVRFVASFQLNISGDWDLFTFAFFQGMKPTYAVTIDDIKCAYFDQVDKLRDFGSRNKENIAHLLWGFFNYWAYCHDYANSVISIRTGSVLR